MGKLELELKRRKQTKNKKPTIDGQQLLRLVQACTRAKSCWRLPTPTKA